MTTPTYSISTQLPETGLRCLETLDRESPEDLHAQAVKDLLALQDELEQQTDDQIVSVDSRPGPSGTTSISRTLSNTWRSVKSRKKKKQMLEVNRS